MSVESQSAAYQAGLSGGLPAGVAPEDMASYQAGLDARHAGGRSPPGGGGGLLLVALAAWPLLFLAGICLYPIPGVLTLVGAALLSDLFGVNGLGQWLFLMVPCIAMFMLGFMVESRLEEWALYRSLRHGLRLLFIGFVVHGIALELRAPAGGWPDRVPFIDRLSLLHVALVAAALVGAHLLSRRLDKRWGSASGFLQRLRLHRAAQR